MSLIRYKFSEEINIVPQKQEHDKGKILHTGDSSWDYKTGRDASGLKVGDKVKVLRKAKGFEAGWGGDWYGWMDDFVGKTFPIVYSNGAYGFTLLDGRIGGYAGEFPYFILKKVN